MIFPAPPPEAPSFSLKPYQKVGIIDIETPMSFYPKDGIREVSCIVFQNWEIIDQVTFGDIIDSEMYQKGYGQGLAPIEQDEGYKRSFRDFLEKHDHPPLIAHNADFDRSFLYMWNWIEEAYPFYCSVRGLRKLQLDTPNHKLSTLMNHFGISNPQKHQALEDCLALFYILSAAGHIAAVRCKSISSKVKQRKNELSS